MWESLRSSLTPKAAKDEEHMACNEERTTSSRYAAQNQQCLSPETLQIGLSSALSGTVNGFKTDYHVLLTMLVYSVSQKCAVY